MRTQPRDVDTDALARHVEEEYGLTLSLLSFRPKGEDSFVFVAEDEDRAEHFVRLEEDRGEGEWRERAYTAAEALAQGDVPALVAPCRTRQGGFMTAYGRYLVALFPFIEGRSLSGVVTSEDRARVAEIVAALHESPLSSTPLPREGLENPFEAPIRRALSRVEASMPDANRYQDQVTGLLRAHREDIEGSLRKVEGFRREQHGLIGEWVLTHGEPHPDNFLKDPQGRLHLVDGGELAEGPPERDLFAFSGPDMEEYLAPYLRRRPQARLSHRLYEFYHYRWALQEIADYTTRVLFREMGPEEDEHALKELRDYLPIRHDDIARAAREDRELHLRLQS